MKILPSFYNPKQELNMVETNNLVISSFVESLSDFKSQTPTNDLIIFNMDIVIPCRSTSVVGLNSRTNIFQLSQHYSATNLIRVCVPHTSINCKNQQLTIMTDSIADIPLWMNLNRIIIS